MTTGKSLLLASAAAASLALLASATADTQRRVNDRPLGGPDTSQALKGKGGKSIPDEFKGGDNPKYYKDLKSKQEKMKNDAKGGDGHPKP